jgi:hypothetical protein
MAKAVRNKMETVLTRKFELNLRKKLVEGHIWSIAFKGCCYCDTSERI